MSHTAAQPQSPARRASLVRMVLTFLVMAAVGLGVGMLAGTLAKSTGRDVIGVARTPLPVIGLVVFLGLWTVLLVHELGHLLAGLAQGNRFMLFAAGPLVVRRIDGAVRVQFNRTAALWGGVAATIPEVVPGPALRANLTRVVMWGPIASLLLTLSCAALLPLGERTVRLYLVLTALASFGIFLATTVPSRTGRFYTDGARLRMLREGGKAADRWCYSSALASLASTGVPASEWDRALLERAAQLADHSLDGTLLHLMLYSHATEVGDDARAAVHMAEVRAARETLSPTLQSYVTLESAYWAAVGERDALRARAELQAATTSPFESPIARLRAEGAVRVAEGERVTGMATLDEAERLVQASKDPAMRAELTRIARARALV